MPQGLSSIIGGTSPTQMQKMLAGVPQRGLAGIVDPMGVRAQLYPEEQQFFAENPNVSGMAAADNRVILNPYSKLSDDEKSAVIQNERARILMRSVRRPDFQVTDAQRKLFAGSPYENNEQAIRETLVGRIVSGDPSAGEPTEQQRQYAAWLKRQMQ